MNRFWTRSAIVLSLLIIGSMAIHPPTILAKATKITFTGVTTLSTTGAAVFFEGKSGRLRLDNVSQSGTITISATDPADSAFDIDGGTLVITGLQAHLDLSIGQVQGPFHGSVTILEGASVIFEGSTTGSAIQGIATGTVVAQGRGRFEGTTLRYSFDEIDNSGEFDIEGTILVPGSE